MFAVTSTLGAELPCTAIGDNDAISCFDTKVVDESNRFALKTAFESVRLIVLLAFDAELSREEDIDLITCVDEEGPGNFGDDDDVISCFERKEANKSLITFVFISSFDAEIACEDASNCSSYFGTVVLNESTRSSISISCIELSR